jgi:DNA-binding transcriptional LysR family regulator
MKVMIDLLRTFLLVVQEGNFTRVAKATGLSQPAISSRIAQLERQIGGELFERGGPRLHLTPMGNAFLPYAQRSVTAFDEGMRQASQAMLGRVGSVTVSSLNTQALYMLPQAVQKFRTLYPDVDLSIRLRLPGAVLAMLHHGEATLGLTGAPIWDKNIRIEAHFHEAVRLVAAHNHPLATIATDQGFLERNDLLNHTIYRVTQNPAVTALVEHIVEQARAGSGGAVIYLPSVLALGSLVAGQGVAFLPENFVTPQVERGELQFLEVRDLPPLAIEPVVVSSRLRDLSELDQIFIQLIRESCAHMTLVG